MFKIQYSMVFFNCLILNFIFRKISFNSNNNKANWKILLEHLWTDISCREKPYKFFLNDGKP